MNMKHIVSLIASILIAFNAIAQQGNPGMSRPVAPNGGAPGGEAPRPGVPVEGFRGGGLGPEDAAAPAQQAVNLVLVPFQKPVPPQTPPQPGGFAADDDSVAVQTFVQQVWQQMLDKLPPQATGGLYGAYVRAYRFGDNWIIDLPKDLAPTMVDAIKKELAAAPKLSPEERKAKLDELARECELVNHELTLLASLSDSEAKLSRELLSEKMKELELERQRINMELYAKQERRKALAAEMDKAKTEVSKKVGDDPVLEQLNKIVGLREEGLKRTEELQKANTASIGEVHAAEEKLAEAKMRVAERSELVRQTSGSDVLARATTDMSTIMVDVAELEGRKRYIDSQLPDVATITEPQLQTLLQQAKYYSASSTPPPLHDQLVKKYQEILRQRGLLLVKDVRVVEKLDASASQPTTAP
jgi:hypothetical protein